MWMVPLVAVEEPRKMFEALEEDLKNYYAETAAKKDFRMNRLNLIKSKVVH